MHVSVNTAHGIARLFQRMLVRKCSAMCRMRCSAKIKNNFAGPCDCRKVDSECAILSDFLERPHCRVTRVSGKNLI
jgi:hypothetical protein